MEASGWLSVLILLSGSCQIEILANKDWVYTLPLDIPKVAINSISRIFQKWMSVDENWYCTVFYSVLDSYSCCNKSPQIIWLKTTEMYSLRVLKARNLKWSCQQIQFLRGLCGKIWSMALPKFTVITSYLWWSLACSS